MCYNSRFCGETLVPGTRVGTLTMLHTTNTGHTFDIALQNNTPCH